MMLSGKGQRWSRRVIFYHLTLPSDGGDLVKPVELWGKEVKARCAWSFNETVALLAEPDVYSENRMRKEFDMLQAFRIADGVLLQTGSSPPRARVQRPDDLVTRPRSSQYLLHGDHIFALPT
jgi:hypothetical protein